LQKSGRDLDCGRLTTCPETKVQQKINAQAATR
jgi:hypothetical protein